jgi:hypothetical protein
MESWRAKNYIRRIIEIIYLERVSIMKKGDIEKNKNEQEIPSTSFGISNNLWNALLGVITFTLFITSYVLIGVMSAYFKDNIRFVSANISIPPAIDWLSKVFQPSAIALIIVVVLSVLIFFALHKFFRKNAQLPSFFYISFVSQAVITIILGILLIEYVTLFSAVIGK